MTRGNDRGKRPGEMSYSVASLLRASVHDTKIKADAKCYNDKNVTAASSND